MASMPRAKIVVRVDGDGLDRDVKYLNQTMGVQGGMWTEEQITERVKELVYAHTKVALRQVAHDDR